jgi:hypothetical protein
MQIPIVTPAPVVSQHAEVFRPEFGDERTFRYFQNYLLECCEFSYLSHSKGLLHFQTEK